ncbi:hypothetical protein [Paenibacillus sp. ISL-20]|uniref:hypothetical protein n=1 Tax=Paenibacillus sp. ISL-20 TaxID=2819163 RepID=UPI001BE8B831|nr:hypothetical protein [Paenibacillus sp. ISL-20]MBT2761892.1 hypothetical protein [Paenibacillus sp. ISL-20]
MSMIHISSIPIVQGLTNKGIKFSSTSTLLDSDVLLIDPLTALKEYGLKDYPQTQLRLTDLEYSESLSRDINRRRNEVVEFLNLGRTIFVFTPPPIELSLRYSTSGYFSEVDFRNFMLSYPDTILSSGTQIEFIDNAFFTELWTDFSDCFYYDSMYSNSFGTPLFKVKGTNYFVGAYIKYGNGHIVYLPRINCPKTERANHLAKVLKRIAFQLNENEKKLKFALPEWSNNYFLPSENKIKQDIKLYEQKLYEIQNEIEKNKEDLNSLEEFKLLFTSSGKALEKTVGTIFKTLGFEVAEGLPGRDDLIIKYEEKVAVVEVKGVAKSAAEKHAAQLEKWVSEYFTTKDVMPKGILVVNAFKDVPLKERMEDPFPDQMLKYSKNRNHCLLTGLDLLAIYFFVMENPEKKVQIVENLFSTCGIFESLNWRDFILSEEFENSN